MKETSGKKEDSSALHAKLKKLEGKIYEEETKFLSFENGIVVHFLNC